MTARNIAIVFSPTLGIPAGLFTLLLAEYWSIFIWAPHDSSRTAIASEAIAPPPTVPVPQLPVPETQIATTLDNDADTPKESRTIINPEMEIPIVSPESESTSKPDFRTDASVAPIISTDTEIEPTRASSEAAAEWAGSIISDYAESPEPDAIPELENKNAVEEHSSESQKFQEIREKDAETLTRKQNNHEQETVWGNVEPIYQTTNTAENHNLLPSTEESPVSQTSTSQTSGRSPELSLLVQQEQISLPEIRSNSPITSPKQLDMFLALSNENLDLDFGSYDPNEEIKGVTSKKSKRMTTRYSTA